MIRLLPLAAALSLLVTLPGCPASPKGAPDAGVDAGVALSSLELCDRLAAARCKLLHACFPAFVREPEESCRVQEQARCLSGFDRLARSFEEQKLSIDVGRLERCEARMSGQVCPPTFPPGAPGGASPFPDCDEAGMLKGAVEDDAQCRSDLECQAGSRCFKAGGVCLGVCTKAPTEGEPCGFGCADGLYCDDKLTDPTADDRCVKLKEADAGCQASAECAPELFCAKGGCAARRKAGEGCSWDPQRASTCEPGLACDVAPFVPDATGTCIKPRGLLQSCAFHWSCEPGLVCAGISWGSFPAAPPGPGKCLPPQPVDQPCSYTPFSAYVGDPCQAGAACDPTGSCRRLGSRGESCTPTAPSCTGVGVFCKPLSGGALGTCSGPAELNESCGVQIDAQTTFVIPCNGGYCEESTLTCRSANRVAGDPCKSDAECTSNRCATQEDRTQRCAPACN